MDKDTLDDINRDNAEQAATTAHDARISSDEFKNTLQLKYEALLSDPDMLAEAMGPDGIQYPRNIGEPAKGLMLYQTRRRNQIAYDNSVYYPFIGIAVMREEWEELGSIIGRQIQIYLHKKAREQLEHNND